MINWDNFYVFAAVSICLWLIGAVFALRSSTRSKTAIGFTSGGIIVLAVFITGLWFFLQRPPLRTMGLFRHKEEYLHTADNLVYAGIAFLSIGMLLGSLWAKEAWGNYWSWDPKETWAVITWAGYLLYVHLRLFRKTGRKTLYVLLIMSFLALQMCWYGVNYLPAAQQSVHLYNRNN